MNRCTHPHYGNDTYIQYNSSTHIHMHPYIHPYICMHIILTHPFANSINAYHHVFAHSQTRTPTHTGARAHTHIYTHTYIHAYTHTHTRARAHTNARAHVPSFTHSHKSSNEIVLGFNHLFRDWFVLPIEGRSEVCLLAPHEVERL